MKLFVFLLLSLSTFGNQVTISGQDIYNGLVDTYPKDEPLIRQFLGQNFTRVSKVNVENDSILVKTREKKFNLKVVDLEKRLFSIAGRVFKVDEKNFEDLIISIQDNLNPTYSILPQMVIQKALDIKDPTVISLFSYFIVGKLMEGRNISSLQR